MKASPALPYSVSLSLSVFISDHTKGEGKGEKQSSGLKGVGGLGSIWAAGGDPDAGQPALLGLGWPEFWLYLLWL